MRHFWKPHWQMLRNIFRTCAMFCLQPQDDSGWLFLDGKSFVKVTPKPMLLKIHRKIEPTLHLMPNIPSMVRCLCSRDNCYCFDEWWKLYHGKAAENTSPTVNAAMNSLLFETIWRIWLFTIYVQSHVGYTTFSTIFIQIQPNLGRNSRSMPYFYQWKVRREALDMFCSFSHGDQIFHIPF